MVIPGHVWFWQKQKLTAFSLMLIPKVLTRSWILRYSEMQKKKITSVTLQKKKKKKVDMTLGSRGPRRVAAPAWDPVVPFPNLNSNSE